MLRSRLLHALKGARRRLGDSTGVTLMETLVASVMGVVVMLALFAILDFSAKQTSRATDLVQATQLGRNAMSHITDELRSACTAAEAKPIEKQSTGSTLIFTNAFSESAVISKESSYLHKIAWISSEKGGALWESTWNATGEPEAGVYTFPSTSTTPNSKVLLAEDISEASTSGAASEESAPTSTSPIFTYYKYSTTPGAVESNKSVSTLTPVSPPSGGFTEAEADEIAAVQVAFRAAPVDGTEALGRAVDLSGQVTLAFSAPNAESTIKGGPCE